MNPAGLEQKLGELSAHQEQEFALVQEALDHHADQVRAKRARDAAIAALLQLRAEQQEAA